MTELTDVAYMEEDPDYFDTPRGPTFEDLAIDDSLSEIDRIVKYICSNIALQRVIHAKLLPDTARTVGFDVTCDRLIPLLERLVCDNEYVVRQHVALQFPPLSQFLVSNSMERGYTIVVDKMIPLITTLISDKQHEVRQAGTESLVEIAALVRPEDQGQHILTIVLPLAHEDDNEVHRMTAVSLYEGLAPHLGQELCQQFCVPELISLSEDPVFRVRKATAQCFASVCRTAGRELSCERLIPSFQRLAQDDIWAVRKSCAENLYNISTSLHPDDRSTLLIPILVGLLEDSSRWVRLAAYQSLGPFLSSLTRKDITDSLLQHFLDMATSAGAAHLGGSTEVDLKFHCAFNFPAVVSILTTCTSSDKAERESVVLDGWSQLSSTFETLSQDGFWKIRRTLAYSLHELARMVGPSITETELSTAFDTYLRDIPDVKMGATLHFADFLQSLSPSFRESYLSVLNELVHGLCSNSSSSLRQRTTSQNSLRQDDEDNETPTTPPAPPPSVFGNSLAPPALASNKWRTREIITMQLPQLCAIFSAEATFSVIYPLVMDLLTDDVSVVRQQCVHACPLLVARIAHNSEWRATVITRFEALANSYCFTERQVFARICQSFVSMSQTPELEENGPLNGIAFFSEYLSILFFRLASDGVSNVRLVFADVVIKHQDVLLGLDSCPQTVREAVHACRADGSRVVESPDDLMRTLRDPRRSQHGAPDNIVLGQKESEIET